MDTFLTTVGQQLTSYANVRMMSLIHTGDRVADAAIQLLLSTIVGGIITGIIALIKNRALLLDSLNYFNTFFNTKAYNPKEFDPSMASGKPYGKAFLYTRQIGTSDSINTMLNWFFLNHQSKKYAFSSLENSLLLPSSMDLKTMESMDLYLNYMMRDIRLSTDTNIPIWRHLDGSWVYLHGSKINASKTITEFMYISSDSADALRACLDDIDQFKNTICEYRKTIADQTKSVELQEYDGKDRKRIGLVPNNKVFDTLFFTDKDKILPTLKGFKEKTLFPKHLPIDNKLGILLYGPPGTGKTGFISALANYLGRTVVMIDMSRIRTRTQLDTIFTIPQKDYIFVFEEFDTMQCVKKREKKEEKPVVPEDPNNPHMAYAMMLMADKKEGGAGDEWKKEMEAARDKIDLGYFLRKLDGLESGDGRMIVATTNHPERIDPALLRPGRFGIQLNLTNATKQMVRDIVGMIYQASVSEEDVEGIEDLKWSPATILQQGLLYTTPSDLLNYLRTAEPSAA
jgi:hypothetical protein